MAALPYMPLYIADYLADAAHLSTVEHGAYLLLIMTYWQRGQPLPADDRKLARIVRMTEDEWMEIRETIADFFVFVDGELVHGRIEAELRKVREKSDKARQAGKKSAAVRRPEGPEKQTDVQRTFNGRSTDDERTSNHTDTDTDTEKEGERVTAPVADATPPAKPAKRKTRIPEPFVVDDAMRVWASENAGGVDLERETAKFVDHFASRGGTMLDWRRAWQNWLRRSVEFQAARGGPPLRPSEPRPRHML